ncbi:hypothetical protein D3C78_20200 [compost metagenome]
MILIESFKDKRYYYQFDNYEGNDVVEYGRMIVQFNHPDHTFLATTKLEALELNPLWLHEVYERDTLFPSLYIIHEIVAKCVPDLLNTIPNKIEIEISNAGDRYTFSDLAIDDADIDEDSELFQVFDGIFSFSHRHRAYRAGKSSWTISVIPTLIEHILHKKN